MIRAVLLFALVTAPAMRRVAAQSVPDSTLRRELDSLVVVQAATARYCGTTNATQYMRAACRLLDSTIARLARQVVPAPPPPPPPAALTLSLERSDSVLRTNPGVFLTVRVDSGGRTISDSAAFSLSDTIARLYWNKAARRVEVFRTTALQGTSGPLTITATYGSASAATTIRVESLTSPPPPDTASAPYDSTVAVHVLLENPTPVAGTSTRVCGVFVTRSGKRGLVLLDDASIVNQSGVIRLRADTSSTGATFCSSLAQSRGLALTPGLAPRAGTWEARE
jgi:hypothetical protein